MVRPKVSSSVKPNKKTKAPASPQTAEDFQAQADEEESRGGKWRAGDAAKSARAFQRALSIYDTGLQQFPSDFDLAYNRARLQLEISQQPALLPHWGVSHADFLAETLAAHRRALSLNDGEVDLLFNTSQVLTSLAEEMSSLDRDADAVSLLHETLELLSSCLAKQELMLEQQSSDEVDNANEQAEDDGGVPVTPTSHADSNKPDPTNDTSAKEMVTATVIEPVGASDLLDTVHASLAALTTLVAIADEAALPNLDTMATSITHTKATAYISLLPEQERTTATLSLALDRATFFCALSNARFGFHDIDLQTYAASLSSFDIPGKTEHAQALSNEAEARTELVLSALDRLAEDDSISVVDCWRQLSQAQDLLTQATKVESEEAKELRPELYKRKGDAELLRVRIAALPSPAVTDAIRNSGSTLLKNARTFYKAAIGHASTAGDDATAAASTDRLGAVQYLMDLDDDHQQRPSTTHGISTIFADLVDEGLVDNSLLDRLSAMLV